MSSPFLSSWNGYAKFLVGKRVSPLPTTVVGFPKDLPSEVDKQVLDYGSSQIKKAKKLETSADEKSEETLFFIRYLYHYQEESKPRSLASSYLTEIIHEYTRASSDPKVVECIRLLKQIASHPAVAFLVQSGIDEIVTAQAEKFLWRKDVDEEDVKYAGVDVGRVMEMPALLYWMYLVSHQSETTVNPTASDVWKVWHLFLLAQLKPSMPVLMGLTADDAPNEVIKLLTDSAYRNLFHPLVVSAVSNSLKDFRGDPLVAVRGLLYVFFLFCRDSFPQLKRAFPDLVNWEEMIYYPQNGVTRLLSCAKCWNTVSNFAYLSDLPETPKLKPGADIQKYKASTVFQRDVFNSGEKILLRGIKCVNNHPEDFVIHWAFYEFPRLILLDLNESFESQVIVMGPSLKTGRYAHYRLYSKTSAIQVYERIDPRTDLME